MHLTATEWLAIGFVVQWVFAALAHSLPKPDEKSGKTYVTLFNLIHFVAANLSLMRTGKPPNQIIN